MIEVKADGAVTINPFGAQISNSFVYGSITFPVA